jgi:ABC-type multidrug transport system fused ATPase/permease subunit
VLALTSFLGIARWVGVKAPLAVVLVGLSALLEGTALLALAPVFNHQLGASRSSAGFAEHLAQSIGAPPGGEAVFWVGLFVVFGLAAAGVRMAGDAVLLWTRTRVEEISRNRMTTALMHMKWEAFAELPLSEIGRSIYQECWHIGVGVQYALQALGLFLAFFCYLAVAALLSPGLTAAAVAVGVVLALGVRGMSRRARSHAERFMAINADFGNRIQDLFGNLKFYRSTGMSDAVGEMGAALFRVFARSYWRAFVLSPLARSCLEIAALCFVSIILYAGVAGGAVDLGETIIFLGLFFRAAPRLNTLNETLFQTSIYINWYSDWRARLAFAEQNREVDPGPREVQLREAICLRGVHFLYPKREHHALNDLDLCIGAREFVAIVGPSGSGKSTVLDLVTGVLRPTAGRIEVDGVDLAEISLEAWRRRLGIVLQETPLFPGTVLDNVVWGSRDRDEKRAAMCLQHAHAAEIIARLPGGLDGDVGERGLRLSGGERQRVALARALYRDPDLLILDEATSALDSIAEEEVLTALRDLKGRFAIVIVSHRLAAVRDADRIVVLSGGKVVEQGPWSELVARPDGFMREMARRQDLLVS